MVLTNLIATVAIVIFNLTLLSLLVELMMLMNWLGSRLKQRASYEAVIINPYQVGLAKVSRACAILLVSSVLLSIYFWKFY